MPDCHRYFLACFFIVSADVACSAQISDCKISADVTGIGRKRDAKRQGQGLGMAAAKPVLAPAFRVSGLRLMSRSKPAYKERAAALIDSKWHDGIMTGIFAREFSAQKDMLQGK